MRPLWHLLTLERSRHLASVSSVAMIYCRSSMADMTAEALTVAEFMNSEFTEIAARLEQKKITKLRYRQEQFIKCA